ncbi:uncharacterized protein LOC132203547 [Neocloeon triangulifer]|uniref:uncharacterized protein LOC132203547 n=1 Tax=Neocloeon triangulifer TaxID=2078957 RepID=UPI00286F07ED|nr:uncharacterized protein LOC132203547 [Neocloeon triangulifer]
MHTLRVALLLALLVSAASAKSFLSQLLSWDLGLTKDEAKADAKQGPGTPISNCVCDGPGCVCCTDFNLTYIDLGGPGCVSLKYLSPEEGMAVNVSYGDSLLHSEVVKGPNPEPTCMNLLTDLAQVCARISDLNPTAEGMRGCVHMEPKLLGEATAEYDVGCFRVGPQGMIFDPPANNTRPEGIVEANPETASAEEEEEGPSEEEVIAAVNETAEQGLAFLGSLFGIDFGVGKVNATEAPEAEAPASEAPSQKAGRAFTNPRLNEV